MTERYLELFIIPSSLTKTPVPSEEKYYFEFPLPFEIKTVNLSVSSKPSPGEEQTHLSYREPKLVDIALLSVADFWSFQSAVGCKQGKHCHAQAGNGCVCLNI